MKIEVSRVQNEKTIEFTIKVTEPHTVPFTLEEANTLSAIQQFNNTMSAALNPASKLYHDIVCATHDVKEKMVCRVSVQTYMPGNLQLDL